MPEILIRPSQISANGSSNGQVLTSNGSVVYWANNAGGSGGGSSTGLTGNSQVYTSNGSATITLASSINPADAIVSLNGLLLIPTTDYTLSNTTLTFTTTPASGDSIEVRTFTGSVSGSGGGTTTAAETINQFLLMGA